MRPEPIARPRPSAVEPGLQRPCLHPDGTQAACSLAAAVLMDTALARFLRDDEDLQFEVHVRMQVQTHGMLTNRAQRPARQTHFTAR